MFPSILTRMLSKWPKRPDLYWEFQILWSSDLRFVWPQYVFLLFPFPSLPYTTMHTCKWTFQWSCQRFIHTSQQKIPLHAWPSLCLRNIHAQNELPLRLILEKSKGRLWERVESLCSLESQVSSFLKHVVGWESGL